MKMWGNQYLLSPLVGEFKSKALKMCFLIDAKNVF